MPVVLKYEISCNTGILQRKKEYTSVNLTHGRFHTGEACNTILKMRSLKKNENVYKESSLVCRGGGFYRDQNDDGVVKEQHLF